MQSSDCISWLNIPSYNSNSIRVSLKIIKFSPLAIRKIKLMELK